MCTPRGWFGAESIPEHPLFTSAVPQVASLVALRGRVEGPTCCTWWGVLHPLTPVSSFEQYGARGVLCGSFLLIQIMVLPFPHSSIWSSQPVRVVLPHSDNGS